MSVWSGIAAAGVAIALAFVAAGQPLWEWRLDGPQTIEAWTYSPFVARHTVYNKSLAQTTEDRTYTYAQLASLQPRMASVFSQFGSYFLLGLLAAFGGLVLGIASAWKRIRGILAGVPLLLACAAVLFVSLNLVLQVPSAATADNLGLGGPIPEFRGQAYLSQAGGNAILTWTPVVGWIVVLAAGLALAWGASDLWHVRPAKRREPRPEGLQSAEPAVREVPRPPPVVAIEGPVPPEPVIEEVFVIASNGLLVKHMSRSLMSDKDRDVVGGMISAISSFVREAFTERDGEVHEVTLGQHRFVMCNDAGLVVAVLVTTGETEDIMHRLRHLLALLKDRYGEQLANWQGAPIAGIEDELTVLWEPFHIPPPPAM